MLPVRNVFQKLSRTEQRREGVVAYLWSKYSFHNTKEMGSWVICTYTVYLCLNFSFDYLFSHFPSCFYRAG
jgi:hypothetical protein